MCYVPNHSILADLKARVYELGIVIDYVEDHIKSPELYEIFMNVLMRAADSIEGYAIEMTGLDFVDLNQLEEAPIKIKLQNIGRK